MMLDILEEIDFLENVAVIMQEGASDEKRNLIDAIYRRINRKTAIVEEFEMLYEEDGA